MSIPSSPEVEEVIRVGKSKMHGTPVYLFTPTNLEALRAAQHAASTQPLLAEIERLKGENEDLSNERDRAVEGLLRFVAHPDAEDGADGALCALVARAEAEALKLREALKELRGFFGVKAECRVPEQVARDIIDKALGES